MDIRTIVSSAASKLDSLARIAVKKGGEAAESAKLNLALRSEQKKLDTMFTTLGKLFYEQVKGTDVRTQVKAQIMEIDEQKLVIEELKLTIAEANGKATCTSCGNDIEIDAVYCPVCGSSQATKKCGEAVRSADAENPNAKPLNANDFVTFFKNTTDRYFTK